MSDANAAGRMTVAGVLLAAGQSRRFHDGDKLLATLGGTPVILRAARGLVAGGAAPLVVVTAPHHDRRRAALSGVTVLDVHAEGEQSSSLTAGIGAVPASAAGAILMPADMPLVTPEIVQRLLGEFHAAGGRAIVYPSIANVQYPPVVWPRDLFGDLRALQGDGGAKPLIRLHTARAVAVPFESHDAFIDIDTRDDLARAEAAMGSASS